MGRGRRVIPVRMPDKLKAIRIKKNLTMEQMAQALMRELSILDYKNIIIQSGHIAEYEQGKREPLLPTILAYAKLSQVRLEVFVDNQVDLPAKFKT
jgi:transcriptional regulator with XRE-family HTH domain